MMHVPNGCPRSLFVAAMAMSVLATDLAAADAATREPGWFIVPDTTAFLGLLDRARPEFAPVGEALDRGDLDAAVAAYAAWFRARAFDASAVTDWRGRSRDATYNTSRADGLLAGDFWDGYSVWTVPETGFDWFGSPLSCCTRFPVLGTLRQAAHHTRDAKYARFMVEHILDYMRAYPIAEFVGTSTRSGWTNHTTVAKPWYWCMIPERLSELAETLALIRAFPEVTDRELVDVLRRMYEETGYLTTEIEAWVDRRHNGGGAMIEAMAKSCAVLADFRATDAWADVTAGLVAQYLDEAFYPDGMCVELTTAYSAGVSVTQQRLAYLFRERPAILARRDKLAAMVTVLAALSDPTGLLPSFGDLRAGQLSGYVHRPLAEWLEMPWIDALLSRRDEPRPPFTAWPVPGQEPWCGYYTMRSDWSRQARYLAIDGGPWGTTHQHGDRLSVALTAFGQRFIIDPPGTRYASNEPDAFIGLQPSGFLHNTITIDGVDVFRSDGTVAETKVPLTNTWEHGARYSFFAGDYSFRPVKPVTWERRIVFVDGAYWLLQDVLTGDLAEAAVEQNFQFEADITIAFDKGVTIATAPGGARLLIIPLDSALAPILTRGDTEPHTTYWPGGKPTTVLRHEDGHDQKHGRGWSVGRRGDQLIPAPAVTYTGRCTLPGILTMALVPLAPGQDLTAAPRIVSQQDGEQTLWTLPTGDGALEFAASPGRAVVSERLARPGR